VIVIVIPAKGDSRRLPNKNMVVLNGRPMLQYTIEEATRSKRAPRVYVSTDSDTIAEYVGRQGIPVIRRSEALGGDVSVTDVYRHAVENIEAATRQSVSVLVGLQPDHPDRDVGVDEALGTFESEGADRLMSEDATGTHNGAHYILSRHFLETGKSRKDVVIVDDCTNVHCLEDLDRPAGRLRTSR
jgi:CMP-N-acetylneuraminic acid synthetase